MENTYAVVFKKCSSANEDQVTQLLGRAFALKSATCASIVNSKPIIIMSELSLDELAAASLALRPLEVAGATLQYINGEKSDLPKIDWPKTPRVFKQELKTFIASYNVTLKYKDAAVPLLEMLKQQILDEQHIVSGNNTGWTV